MGSSMSAIEITASVNVPEKTQKNLGGYTHLIFRTILMQIMIQSLSGADKTTYVNVPTCDGQRLPLWQASVTYSFKTRTGPSKGYIFEISWRMCGNARPKCIDS